jgi:paraquat-inducible protein A
MSTDLTLAPARRRVIFALLAASLVCNAAAMLSPFMDLRVGAFSEPYSLTRSVKMMWSQGLYVLAVLVVGFSVFFPFAKIGVLAWVAGGRALDARRRRWLGVVEMLGKWSMLDVFLVCLILTLTSGQIMVGAKPLIGIPLFVAAIFLSMLSGELLTGALRHEVAASPHRPSAQTGAYLLLQGIALLGTLTLPILRISDWKLADHTYSVLTVVPTLWAKNSPVSAVVVTAFLLLAPLVGWLATLRHWWQQRADRPCTRSHALANLLQRWSMLDVFGLALAIFLIEGDYLMRTEVRWGAACLVMMLALQKAFQLALARSLPPS